MLATIGLVSLGRHEKTGIQTILKGERHLGPLCSQPLLLDVPSFGPKYAIL